MSSETTSTLSRRIGDRMTVTIKAATAALAGIGFVAVAVWGTSYLASAQEGRTPPPSRAAMQYSFSPVVKKAAPAVVNVYVRSKVRTAASPFANDPFFQRFFGGRGGFGLPQERVQSSLGSGVIISPDGVIVTNTHVVRGGTDTQIRVALADKREFDARIVAQDERTDLAVLKIEKGGDDFPYLEFADSDALEVGDMVLAIGNPFGVGQTVTSGIISALARTEMAQSDTQVFLQTDAAINPGNSGGGLVDMDGRLAGINTMIFSKTGGSVGIGFAIPSNLVRFYADNAVAGRKIERPWLGAQLETVSREMAATLGLERVAGAVVVRLTDNSPATKAGVQLGDVIVKVDEFDVADAHSVLYRLTTRGVGNSANLEVIRGGKLLTHNIALLPAPKPGKDDVRNLSGNHPFDGARVSNILPSVADEFNLDETDGVAIVAVRSGGVAARLDFQPGDIIVEIGNERITDVIMLDELTRNRQRIWRVTVKRGGRLMKLQMAG